MLRKTMGRLRHRVANLSVAATLGLAVAGLGAWALGPVVPVLLDEWSFASDVKSLGADKRLSQMSDTDIRSQVQQYARARGFHIEFDDIFVEYLKTPQAVGVPLPSKLGYTLRIELPLFGLVDWSLVALRSYPVGE